MPGCRERRSAPGHAPSCAADKLSSMSVAERAATNQTFRPTASSGNGAELPPSARDKVSEVIKWDLRLTRPEAICPGG
jgi:hypothetical protein